jgi:hypothetical protein
MFEGASRHRVQIDRFFGGPGARGDQWRNLVELAEAWKSGLDNRAKFDAELAELTDRLSGGPIAARQGRPCWFSATDSPEIKSPPLRSRFRGKWASRPCETA